MRIYRIAKQKYLTDMSGQGARLFGGRWNKIGHNMLYCSSSLSLCVLEILVHMDYKFITPDYGFVEIELPESTVVKTVEQNILEQQWRTNPPLSITQQYGTDWLQSQKSLALKVPSAVLPNEFNVLLNPNHIDFSKVKISESNILDIDGRIFDN